MGLDNPVLLF